MLTKLRDDMEGQLARFHTYSGVAVVEFLKIVECYLKNFVMKQDYVVMAQEEGACIGYGVAPFLAELYFNTVDKKGKALMNEIKPGILFIARYVDNIFVCFTEKESLIGVSRNLFQISPYLNFIFEEPEDGELHYLDLIILTEPGLRSMICKRSPKSVMPAESFHPKTVKGGKSVKLIEMRLANLCHCKHSNQQRNDENRFPRS